MQSLALVRETVHNQAGQDAVHKAMHAPVPRVEMDCAVGDHCPPASRFAAAFCSRTPGLPVFSAMDSTSTSVALEVGNEVHKVGPVFCGHGRIGDYFKHVREASDQTSARDATNARRCVRVIERGFERSVEC
jgi:hypothetical protein